MVRVLGPLPPATLCSTCFRVLEAVHQAFVGHVAWFYVVECALPRIFLCRGVHNSNLVSRLVETLEASSHFSTPPYGKFNLISAHGWLSPLLHFTRPP